MLRGPLCGNGERERERERERENGRGRGFVALGYVDCIQRWSGVNIHTYIHKKNYVYVDGT